MLFPTTLQAWNSPVRLSNHCGEIPSDSGLAGVVNYQQLDRSGCSSLIYLSDPWTCLSHSENQIKTLVPFCLALSLGYKVPIHPIAQTKGSPIMQHNENARRTSTSTPADACSGLWDSYESLDQLEQPFGLADVSQVPDRFRYPFGLTAALHD